MVSFLITGVVSAGGFACDDGHDDGGRRSATTNQATTTHEEAFQVSNQSHHVPHETTNHAQTHQATNQDAHEATFQESNPPNQRANAAKKAT